MLKPLLWTATLSMTVFANEGGDRVDTKFEVFRDRNDVMALAPVISIAKSISRNFSIDWEAQLDAVTGASREWGLIGSGQKLDANSGALTKLDGVSGASAREGGEIEPEIRAGSRIGLTWTDKKGGILTGSLYGSKENDYQSFSPAIGGSWDFGERNTTVSWGASWFFDKMTPYGSWGVIGGGPKWVHSYNLGASQLISPLTLIGANATFTRTTGYIGHPYNPVTIPGNGMVIENLPSKKEALALAGQFVQGFHLGEELGSLNTEYRWYTDSWNLRSHTLTLRWNQHISEASVVRLQTRIYSQTGAAFATTNGVGNELYRTADIRFFPFKSLLLGVKYSSEFPDNWPGLMPRRWDISYDHLWRDTKGNPLLYQLYASNVIYMQGTARAGLSWDL
ncbi:MAG: hypothetical protein RL173_1326 [Fibrobacterota bacterium]|jgi:hypothetical protein